MLSKTFSAFYRSRGSYSKFLQISDSIQFGFARNIKEKPKQQKKIQTITPKSESNEEEKVEEPKPSPHPQSFLVDDKFISSRVLVAEQLPKKLLNRCQSVFSKFPVSEVRKMGMAYMKLSQMLQSSEKPCDLSATRPFSNTEELTKDNKSLIYLGRKRRHEEAPSASEEEKSKEKEKNRTKDEKGKNLDAQKSPTIEYDNNTALAYLQRKMPHTFGVARRILTEIRYRLPEFQPLTFLDYGAGLGSAAYASSVIYQDIEKIVAIEPATPMRKLGKFLSQDLGNIMWFDSLSRIINVHNLDGLFDIVYLGHVLDEVISSEARRLVIETLWQKVRPGGLMILVEPGSPKGFRYVHDFRSWIVEKPRTEANIIAPCPHHNECPMSKPAHIWCNFEQKIAKYPNTVFQKLPQQETIDNEKFCYLVVKKGEIIKDPQLAESPAEKSFFWSRIIKKTLKRSGHAILDVCNIEGKLERIIVAKSHGEEGGYRHSRKVKWGDLWNYSKRVPNKYRKEESKGERLW